MRYGVVGKVRERGEWSGVKSVHIHLILHYINLW